MAKTIVKLAKDYATNNYAIHDGKTANPLIVSKISFEAGANAVIEEIDNILFNSLDDSKRQYKIAVNRILRLIRELKGK